MILIIDPKLIAKVKSPGIINRSSKPTWISLMGVHIYCSETKLRRQRIL
jgi:hypothetical protein